MLLVVLIIMLTETVYAIECFFGEDVLVRDAEGMEEVLQLILKFCTVLMLLCSVLLLS